MAECDRTALGLQIKIKPKFSTSAFAFDGGDTEDDRKKVTVAASTNNNFRSNEFSANYGTFKNCIFSASELHFQHTPDQPKLDFSGKSYKQTDKLLAVRNVILFQKNVILLHKNVILFQTNVILFQKKTLRYFR